MQSNDDDQRSVSWTDGASRGDAAVLMIRFLCSCRHGFPWEARGANEDMTDA